MIIGIQLALLAQIPVEGPRAGGGAPLRKYCGILAQTVARGHGQFLDHSDQHLGAIHVHLEDTR